MPICPRGCDPGEDRAGSCCRPATLPLVASERRTTVAIVVTGDPVPTVRERHGGFARLLERAAGQQALALREIDARSGDLPNLSRFAGVLVTGSPESVLDRAPWMVAAGERLRAAVDAGTPVLGICFGHQLLAHALGGVVERNPKGREIGTVPLEVLAPDPLLDPEHRPFTVNMTHVDTVLEPPPCAEVVARTALDGAAVLRFAEDAWGVQFHPEIDAEVMCQYVEARSALIAREGLDVAAIRSAIRDTVAGRDVLRRFLARVATRAFGG